MAGRLAGKVAIVTGASRGIGRAIAERFAREGAAVVLVARTAERLDEVAAGIARDGGSAAVLAGDATTEAVNARMVELAERRFGRVTTLVANMGADLTATVADTTPADWNACLASDLSHLHLGARAALPSMIAAGGGAIVAIASTAALRGIPNHAAYCAAKAGLASLTRSIAVDYGRRGVRANCICPGAIETEMLAAWLRSFGDAEADVRARLLARSPLDRMGRADEIASVACFLASDEASYVTGVVIPVDGGTSAA
ncbi:MAG TPA: SDR family NAD(P)-dependent oxidoreductase [Candidatus Binatia bacterium]|nr:SDR family NAD(P)-dependent oxidoreductase [Candidatus Binatia bacterium]